MRQIILYFCANSEYMIRTVTSDDAESILAIYNQYIINSVASFEVEPLTLESMRNRIIGISSEYPYFVDESNGEITGFCYAHPWKERAAYKYTLESTIYIAPKYIRKGIGMRLMNKLIDCCRQHGYHSIIACITGNNTASIALHEALGFSQASHFKNVGIKFDQQLDVLDYQLIITETPT